jgi:hypothetical protein
MEDLPKTPATRAAGSQGIVADPLEHLDVRSTVDAGVLVGRHGSSRLYGWHPGTPPFERDR